MKVIPQSQTLSIPRDYATLCQLHLPRPIRNRSSYKATVSVLNTLKSSVRKPGKDQQDYLDLLTFLIQRYDGLTISMTTPKPLSLLKQLIDEHKLSNRDLAKILGRSLSLGSMILNGQRTITREHAVRLGKYFGMAPEPFLA